MNLKWVIFCPLVPDESIRGFAVRLPSYSYFEYQYSYQEINRFKIPKLPFPLTCPQVKLGFMDTKVLYLLPVYICLCLLQLALFFLSLLLSVECSLPPKSEMIEKRFKNNFTTSPLSHQLDFGPRPLHRTLQQLGILVEPALPYSLQLSLLMLITMLNAHAHVLHYSRLAPCVDLGHFMRSSFQCAILFSHCAINFGTSIQGKLGSVRVSFDIRFIFKVSKFAT
jgi:hypothetical protein